VYLPNPKGDPKISSLEYLEPTDHANDSSCGVKELQKEYSFMFADICPDTNQR
jgi:hypothetical protein